MKIDVVWAGLYAQKSDISSVPPLVNMIISSVETNDKD